MVVTIAQRKEQEILRLVSAAAAASKALGAYAAAHDGRFTLVGSFARGDIVPDSDFDVLVTFPASAERAARDSRRRPVGTLGSCRTSTSRRRRRPHSWRGWNGTESHSYERFVAS